MRNINDKVYLGDAVYAQFDGFNIQLTTGDGNNQIIYLEQPVMDALIKYNEALKAEIEKRVQQEGKV